MRVLFASAELAPYARVGGMAEANSGLTKRLRAEGVDLMAVLPDYGGVELADETVETLDLPSWVGSASVRSGTGVDGTPLWLVDAPGMARPHPYNDEQGRAFEDNDFRFFAFSAAVAAMAERHRPDVVHLNDWHTAPALGMLPEPMATVLTIHTLGYQGTTHERWMEHLPRRAHLFAWYGGTNPLLGGIRLADRVVTVSPNYAAEILDEQQGMGLHQHLRDLGGRLVGIINGIDVEEWSPETDPYIPANFSADNLRPKAVNRTRLIKAFDLDADGPNQPIVAMVGRLVDQKGIDLLVDAGRFLEHLPARMVILGSGDLDLTAQVKDLAARHPGRVGFVNDYDLELGHLIFAGADLMVMPSRFEPCGLAQMQAMAYGTIPVVNAVGGLVDTVIDDDAHPDEGTGFVSPSVDTAGLVDALHRAARAWSSTKRRSAIRKRGMAADWSWSEPAARYRALYQELIDSTGR